MIVFEVFQEEDGGFIAECLTEDIFSQGDTWDEATGQIVDIHQKYVGNIFKDRFIRGRENTDYDPKSGSS